MLGQIIYRSLLISHCCNDHITIKNLGREAHVLKFKVEDTLMANEPKDGNNKCLSLGMLETAQAFYWEHVSKRLLTRHISVEKPRWLPLKIQIEATSKCNLSCPSCSNSKEINKGQHLTKDALNQILDCIPLMPSIIVSGIGEPLVNPDFFSLIDILAERRINCGFFTNGTMLTKQNREEILSRCNISYVKISCDSARKETFECLRLGANYEQWVSSVGQFIADAKSKRQSSLNIGMLTVLSKANSNEIRDVISLAAQLGFGCIDILDMIPIDNEAATMCLSKEELSGIDNTELIKFGRDLGISVYRWWTGRSGTPPKAKLRCLQPWEYVFIRSNGDVYPCCVIFSSERSRAMGNIFQQDFMDIWQGDLFRDFRISSSSGKNELCRSCNFY